MERTWVSSSSYRFPVLIFFFLLVVPTSFAQLTPSENRILFQIQQLLEYPPSLQGWSNWTNFCYLPPTSSLTVICSGSHITELTVIGNKTTSSLNPKSAHEQTLSERFSIDSFFTVLTKLSSLKVLSLVSLGLWGPLPAKINRFKSLEVLNLSSNSIYGEIPRSISTLPNLRSLVLGENLFNGSVPDLKSISVLEELDLGNNLLGPQFPSLGEKIVSVILKNNKFRYEIPLELKSFDQLQHFDISFNQIVGKFPPSLLSLPSIQYLNLAGNNLSGTLTTDVPCNKELVFVDLSHNLLSGKLPICIRSNSSSRVVLYSWNCLSVGDLDYQHQSSFCHEEALAVKPPNRVIASKGTSSSKLGLILGVVSAVVGGLLVLVLVIFTIFRRMGSRESGNTAFETASRKDSLRHSPKLVNDARHVSPAMRLGALGLPQYHVFSFEEIEEATNNFDPAYLMGEGSQGQLYKGRLRDGSLVVIRCLRLKQRHSSQSLLRHMETISKLRHRHLVSIIGHCIVTYQDYPNSANTIYLLFEFVSNGTLRNHLTDWRKRDMMKWPQRVAVTIGVAKGIQFLHGGITPGIFGNKLKIENILLDEHLTAKIGTYYLPMPFMVGPESSTNDVDSVDHLDGSTCSAEDGEKDDIYQLGVILLEAITGRPITSQSELDAQRVQLEQASTDGAQKLRGLVDPAIRGSFAYDSLRTTVEISMKCLSKDPRWRPSIEDVLWHLQYSVQVQDGWMPSNEGFSTEL